MLAFLQATAATDTIGWAAGMLTVGVFILAAPYVLAVPLLPAVIGINLVRQARGHRPLGAD